MIVLSDASPLIHLSKLGLLSVLEALFHEVRVSEQVLAEVLSSGDRPGVSEVIGSEHLRREPGDVDAARAEELRARENLGAGEAWTLAAALRLSADLVIVDDRHARAVARRLDIRVVGTLRVIEMGFEARAIPDLRNVYEDVVRHGLRIAPRLLDESLRKHGLATLGQVTTPLD